MARPPRIETPDGLYEEKHKSQNDCSCDKVDGATYIDKLVRKKGYEDAMRRECEAFQAELDCLLRKQADCGTDTDCPKYVTNRIEEMKSNVRVCKATLRE